MWPAEPASALRRPQLGEAINIATRAVHAQLNKQILLRLPMALPPRTDTPSVYISGLLHVAPIYIAFESLWQKMLQGPDAGTESKNPVLLSAEFPFGQNYSSASRHSAEMSDRTRSILSGMYLPGLTRSSRVRADITSLTRWSEDMVEDELHAVARTGRLAEFINHIRTSVERNPHVLLAYAWVLYMALFSGGRFMRASLKSTDDDFWETMPMPVRPFWTRCESSPSQPRVQLSNFAPVDPCTGSLLNTTEEEHTSPRSSHPEGPGTAHKSPLSFFSFNTPRDGEDLKQEFKRRLAEYDELFTVQERLDIVQEASCIFDSMLLLVAQLDAICSGTTGDEGSLDTWSNFLAPSLSLSGSRLRDSVAVAKERSSRAASSRKESLTGSILELQDLARLTVPYSSALVDDRQSSAGKQTSGNNWPAPATNAQKGTAGVVICDVGDEGDGGDDDDRQHNTAHRTVRFEKTLPVPERVEIHHHAAESKKSPGGPGGFIFVERPSSYVYLAIISNLVLLMGLAAVLMGFLYLRGGQLY